MEGAFEFDYVRMQDEDNGPPAPEAKIAVELFFLCFATCLFVGLFVGSSVYALVSAQVNATDDLPVAEFVD